LLKGENGWKVCGEYFGIALGTLAGVLTIVGFISAKSLPKMARRILIAELEERFRGAIEIGEIQVGGVMPLEILAI
jgi:hypothetical protein